MKTQLFDDAARVGATNEKPANANLMRTLVATLNEFARRQRPLFNWMGGSATNTSDAAAEPSVRHMYITGETGAPDIAARMLLIPVANAAAVPKTGLTVAHSYAGSSSSFKVSQSRNVLENINENPALWYPQFLTAAESFHFGDYTGDTARELTFASGSTGVFGPQLRAGMVYEPQIETRNISGVPHPIEGTEVLSTTHLATGSEIIGAEVNDRDMGAIRDFMNRVWRDKRIHFGFNVCRNGTGTLGIVFANQYRYIMDTSIGTGGAAPSTTGPGIAIPLRYSAQGARTTVRIYVRVYARMSGGTDTGSLGFVTRNNSGGMTTAAALTNAPTISGTTWQWYPATTSDFNPATDPYFDGNAGALTGTATAGGTADKVLLMARSNGATDTLLIGGWTMCVRPSVF